VRLLLILAAFLATNMLNAQLLEAEDEYNRGDTLRGTLSEIRSWFDVYHYNLHITINPDEQTIAGYNDVNFKVLKPNQTMQLDLFDNMNIDKIVMDGEELKYTREYNAVFIEMPVTKKGDLQSIRFHYSGTPTVAARAPWDGGFVWEKDKNGKHWVGVACEGFGASSWWPNKDHLSDEPDSMTLSVAIPNDLVFVGNGNLFSKEAEGDDYMRWTWKISYPINNYNVTINIGDYVHFGDTYQSLDGEKLALDYYVLSYNLDKATEQFKQVGPMMACFEEYLGKYPFYDDGFAMVETPYLGMEHQGAIAYGNEYKPGYAGNTLYTGGYDFDYIIIHETGHEWWGNSVSMEDIGDLWIHEAFCTYSESIYVECLHGYEAGVEYVNKGRAWCRHDRPIVGPYGVNEEGSGDMYGKGSLILNTFRHYVNNDDVWWSFIQGLTEDYKHKTVTGQIVLDYLNKKTGLDFTRIYEQYMLNAQLPVLEYKFENVKKKKFTLNYRWVSDAKGFDLPTEYFDIEGNPVRINPNANWQSVDIKMPTSDFNWNVDHFFAKYELVE